MRFLDLSTGSCKRQSENQLSGVVVAIEFASAAVGVGVATTMDACCSTDLAGAPIDDAGGSNYCCCWSSDFGCGGGGCGDCARKRAGAASGGLLSGSLLLLLSLLLFGFVGVEVDLDDEGDCGGGCGGG